jgi:hypothetical protein
MLHEEVFLFIARKTFFHFWGAENGVFCEATTKLEFHIGTNTFYKNNRPPKMDNFSTGISGTFPSTPHEKDKFPPNRKFFVFFI